MGYKEDTIRGVSWMGFLKASTGALSFIKAIVLARIISPAQFGVYGIALLVLAALETFTETGVNVVLIQEEKKDINEFINTAWIVSIARGLVVGSVIFSSSQLISSFFNSQDATTLLMLISIVPVLRGMINPSVVKFDKNLDFHKKFLINGSSLLADVVFSILFVLLTKSPIGLILGIIFGVLVELLLSFIFVEPRPKPKFDKSKFNIIFNKGRWVTVFGIFDFLSSQLDNVSVAKLINIHSLGLYQMAYRLAIVPVTEVTDVVNSVVFPVYSKISGNKKRLFKAFLKTEFLLFSVALPIFLVFFLFPKEIILFILGKNWVNAYLALKILSVYGFLRAVFGATSSLFLSLGKQSFVALITFVRFLGLSLTIIPLTFNFGIVGASYSALISALVEVPLICYLLFVVFRKNKYEG